VTSYVDSAGQQVKLGKELGRGGEGAVLEIVGAPQLVAKVYHHTPETAKTEKLVAMAALHNAELGSIAAWPIRTLHADKGGHISGLLMPRLTGYHDVFKLYGPKSRMQLFPDLTWQQLIHVATNVARAFAVVHKHGHVIGDVNHSVVQVSGDGTVRLIDCDSFQVQRNGRLFTCDVGVLTHQPPEMQNLNSFKGVARTPNYDNFGLAVLIFQILFLARHPFVGVTKGEMPIERAIAEFRFAYGTRAALFQTKPPPFSLELNVVTTHVAQLFERAFSPDAPRAGRPAATEWAAALDSMKSGLTRCAANSGHFHLAKVPACPLCKIEQTAGLILFLPPLAGVDPRPQGGQFNIGLVWARIEAVKAPGSAPGVSRPAGRPSPAFVEAARSSVSTSNTRRIGAVVLGLAGAAIAFSGLLSGIASFWLLMGTVVVAAILLRAGEPKELKKLRSNAQKRAREVDQHYRRLLEHWQREAGDAAFHTKLNQLWHAKQAYEALASERTAKLRQLESDKRRLQLDAFLDRFEIEDAKIDRVGSGRKAILESHGIETAADIKDQTIRQVPGFGPALRSNLMDWRRSCESKFVYDPTKAVDRSAIATVENEIAAKRSKHEAVLNGGPAELTRIQQAIIARRSAMRPILEKVLADLAQAEADAKV
jgi:DNA-binding helix-hairpin-helix protein with protein kinase domain